MKETETIFKQHLWSNLIYFATPLPSAPSHPIRRLMEGIPSSIKIKSLAGPSAFTETGWKIFALSLQ